jgi:Putative DNA-binding domain
MSREQRTEAAIAERSLVITSRTRRRDARRSSLHIAPEPSATPPARELALDSVQRWLQAVIVHPGDVDEAIASPAAAQELPPDRLAEIVKPSHSLTSAERVEIYHGMYLLRMVEALESDYPAIRHFLGEEAFEELVRDYVERYPSRSYTLNRLGDHMPRFFLDEPDRPHAAFLHELAATELAVTQTFDEEESPVLDAEALHSVPETRWATLRLRPIRALRLLSLRYAVTAHLEAAKHDRPVPRPRRRATFLAVYRQNYAVFRLELGRIEYSLLAALVGGAPLGEAISAAALSLRESRREDTVFKWFRSWIAEGLFSEIAPE